MFSDTYTNVAVDTWRTPWSQGNLEDVVVVVTIQNSALNFVGVETIASQLMQHL
jgi:hypothetical protein